MSKLHVKKGDTVLVLSGNDKGKQGKVMRVDVKTTELSSKALESSLSTPAPTPSILKAAS